ncbi:MAG TPA: recombinase family protein [Campylobacteraceae bacterium]|nr:recombinase family protein [Campylobacteraceae bacterium]
MIVAYLRGKNRNFSISFQQEYLISYALKKGIAIDFTEIDDDPFSTILEERSTLLSLLHSLKEGDRILVYDLWVISKKVGELTKVFDCILKNGVSVIIARQDVVIDDKTSLKTLVYLLSEQREQNLHAQHKVMGRPKGSFSKSKFDKYKSEILDMLEQHLSVSEIAKRLGVSRSSLKDYINSRSLKEIVDSKKIPQMTRTHTRQAPALSTECTLKNQKIQQKEH